MNMLWIVYIILFVIGAIFIQYVIILALVVAIIVAGLAIMFDRRFWK